MKSEILGLLQNVKDPHARTAMADAFFQSAGLETKPVANEPPPRRRSSRKRAQGT